MKTSFPLFKPTIRNTEKPINNIIEIVYHTLLPCIITYLIVKQEMVMLFPILLIPLLIRYRPEEINMK